MKRGLVVSLGWLALFALGSQAHANPGGISIAIKFAADEPPGVGSPVNGPAGVLRTQNWNNVSGANGAVVNLNADVFDSPAPIGASVAWSSPNTWSSAGRGEENNSAPAGPDRNLMLGYIDTGNSAATGATVTVSGIIPDIMPFGYDVYVYYQGGVNGRFGDYTINGVTKRGNVVSSFNGTYTEGPNGNYLVFEDVNLPGGFTLTALAGGAAFEGFRAPVNAIEIVFHQIPEPSTLALAGAAVAGLLVFRRYRARKRSAA